MCKISVIMGCYNIEHLWSFPHAMNSILHQTMTDFEFIICDDGSTDRTYQCLLDWQQRDPRIRLLHNRENRGLAYSLNRCLSVARGDYIARQDADDISSPDRFEKQLAYLCENPSTAFVGSNVYLFDRSGVWGKRPTPTHPTKRDFLFTTPFVHGSLMFRKEVLRSVNGYCVSKETTRAEDYELEMRLYAIGMFGANTAEYLYFYLEDTAAQARRKYKYRIDEAKIRFRGFRSLGLMPKAAPYVIKPLVVGLIPAPLMRMIRRLENKHMKG